MSHKDAVKIIGTHFSQVDDKLTNILELSEADQKAKAEALAAEKAVNEARIAAAQPEEEVAEEETEATTEAAEETETAAEATEETPKATEEAAKEEE